jgi:hypothetical protein
LPATIVPTSFGLRHHYRNLNLGRRVALRTLASFLATFAVLRVITAIIRFQIFPHGPFRYVITRGGLPRRAKDASRRSLDRIRWPR